MRENSLSTPLLFSQSLSSIAPLGSVAAYLTFALAQAGQLTPLAAVIGVLLYGAWVVIAYQYSKEVESAGGTYQFARESLPRILASVTGWLYWGSYMLFIISTSSYLLGIVIPMTPLPPSLLPPLQLGLPLMILGVMLTGVRPPLYYTLVTSVLEILMIFALGVLVLTRTGLPSISLGISPLELASGSLAVSYTVAGGGASFFLGKEAVRGRRAVSRAYLSAFTLAAVSVVFAATYEVAAGGENLGYLIDSGFPGLAIAQEYAGPGFERLMLILTVSSLIGSIIAAYSALSRLTTALVRTDLARSVLLIALIYLGLSSIGLATNNFFGVYEDMTAGSLFSLFLSHTLLSAGFPFFLKRRKALKLWKVILSSLSVFVMILMIAFTAFSLGETSSAGIAAVIVFSILGVIHAGSNMP